MNTKTDRARTSDSLKALATLFAVIAVLGTATDAGAGTKTRSGDFTSSLVPPPACDSPVGVCTVGTLTGGLPSTYWFVMDSIGWAGDYANPTKLAYTGHSVVTDAHGHQLFGSDTGVMYQNPDPTLPSPFVTTVHIVGGDHAYNNAAGQIVATGELTFATGQAVGTYVSAISHGNGG